MFNSVKDQTSNTLSSQRRSVSVGKAYKSAANSPTTTRMVARNHPSLEKGRGQEVNCFTHNLSQLKISYYALKEDHLTFQNEIFTFMEGFKHILSEFGPDMGGNKSKNQMTTKILQLVSELDSTKFEMKRRVEEKDEKIKELQVRLREKDQEICLVQTHLDVKKEEVKNKENSILRLEKSVNLIKQQHQQELNRFENDKSSLENRYLRELSTLKQEKEDIKLRLDKQIHREKQMPTKVGPSRVSDHGRYESLNHEINLLKGDKKNLASQLQAQQTKNKNLCKEKEHSKRLLAESQEILQELEEKVHSLSQELEASIESHNVLQYQFDQSIIHLNEARREVDSKAMQLEEVNTQLEDKSKQLSELKERINQQTQLSFSNRNTARASSSNRNVLNKSRNEKSLNTTVDFNSEREGTKAGELDVTLVSQRQTNRSIPKEASHQTKRNDCTGTVTNLIRQTLKEKELQEKVSKLEEACKGLKTKNDALKTENANLSAKLVIKDNTNSDLKQKLQKFKEQTKSTFSSFDHDSSMTEEIKYLKKLAQNQEKDLKKADLEIKKLTAVKKELEIVLKDSREETQILKSSYTTRGNETSDFDSACIKPQDIDSKAILLTLNKEMERDEQEGQIKLTTESEMNKMNKDSKVLVLLEEGEIEHLQKENYDLRIELLSKDTKLQDLMKLSTNSLKVVTEEFMKMASNKFINIHEKVFKLLSRWSNFENFAQKEILKRLNGSNYTNKEANKKSEEKGNTRSALSDRTLRRENTPNKNKVLNSKADYGSRPRSAEEKMKKVSARAYHSEKKTRQPPPKDNNSFNQRTRLSDKKKLSKSTDDFEKDISSKDLNEEDLSLHQILEEVRYLKKFFTFDDDNDSIGPGPKPSQYDSKEQQKVFEFLSNALSPKSYMNPGLEDIKETEHETDTLQDEISSSTSVK